MYIWHDVGLWVSPLNANHEDLNSEIKVMKLYLNSIIPKDMTKDIEQVSDNNDYILFEGFPINIKTPFSDLLDYTRLTIEAFGLDNYGYDWSYNCGGYQVEYYAAVADTWVYKGGGHLQYKSHPNPHNENSIHIISVGRKAEK